MNLKAAMIAAMLWAYMSSVAAQTPPVQPPQQGKDSATEKHKVADKDREGKAGGGEKDKDTSKDKDKEKDQDKKDDEHGKHDHKKHDHKPRKT